VPVQEQRAEGVVVLEEEAVVVKEEEAVALGNSHSMFAEAWDPVDMHLT